MPNKRHDTSLSSISPATLRDLFVMGYMRSFNPDHNIYHKDHEALHNGHKALHSVPCASVVILVVSTESYC